MSRSRPHPRANGSSTRLLLAVLLIPMAFSGAAQAGPRLVVLGFDGADAELTQRYLDEGRLPHLAALAEEGGFRSLLPTNPPQTPVSWSTFATGLNPGRTEIFDFLARDPASYAPRFCAFDERHRRSVLLGARTPWLFGAVGAGLGLVPLLFAWRFRFARRRLLAAGLGLLVLGGAGGFLAAARLVPASVPDPLNNRKGTTFWELATRAGLEARVLRVPLSFPSDQHERLEMISGLGVPDLRGTSGQPTLYTTRRGLSGGQFAISCIALSDPADGPVDTAFEGPRNELFPDRKWDVEPSGVDYCNPAAVADLPPRLSVPMRVEALGAGRLRVKLGDRTSEIAPGEWSDWHSMSFGFNPLLRVRGMTRFYNQSQPEGDLRVELLASPVNFHSDVSGAVRWCHPPDYGPELSRRLGRFKTMGWAIDTWSVSEGLASERHCLEDAIDTADRFTAILRSELSDPELDLFVQVFAFTDRIQHVFLRHQDPGHPGHDAALALEYEGAVREAYERMDRIVGEARSLVPEDTVFLVLSDHGFAQFRRGLNLNRWLVNHGYLSLTRDPCVDGRGGGRTLEDLFGDSSGTFADVDWSRSKAYALGLGNIYVNLAGREAQGIVRPGHEYRELVERLSRELEGLIDPATGEKPVRRVFHRDEMYEGYDPALMPDLRVANSRHHRVSWDTALGGVPCEELEDNTKAWGADHCSLDPELVKGILFSNRRFADAREPAMADLAPSILAILGVAIPEEWTGRVLH